MDKNWLAFAKRRGASRPDRGLTCAMKNDSIHGAAAKLLNTSDRSLAKKWRFRVPLSLALILSASGFGLAASVAGDAKTPAETWTAPARASHKPNPMPADPKATSQGKDLF